MLIVRNRGTSLNHSHDDGPSDRENVTDQLLTYPLNNTAFGLGDYGPWDTADDTAAWLAELGEMQGEVARAKITAAYQVKQSKQMIHQ